MAEDCSAYTMTGNKDGSYTHTWTFDPVIRKRAASANVHEFNKILREAETVLSIEIEVRHGELCSWKMIQRPMFDLSRAVILAAGH